MPTSPFGSYIASRSFGQVGRYMGGNFHRAVAYANSLREGLVGWWSSPSERLFLLGTRPLIAKGAFSFSAWIRPHDFAGNYNWVSYGSQGSQDRQAVFTDVSGMLHFTPDRGVTLVSYGSLKQGEWVHAVAAYDGYSAKLYVNGVLVAYKNVAVKLYGSDVVLGRDSSGGNVAVGDIKYVGAWKRELTDGECAVRQIVTKEISGLWNEGRGQDYPFGAW